MSLASPYLQKLIDYEGRVITIDVSLGYDRQFKTKYEGDSESFIFIHFVSGLVDGVTIMKMRYVLSVDLMSSICTVTNECKRYITQGPDGIDDLVDQLKQIGFE